MKYAVVKTGGKQYKITEGDVLEVERLVANDKKEFIFEDVLLYTADGALKIGSPFLAGITVTASVIEDIRGPKIRVAKFKAKARYRRVTGHRQALTKIKIEKIEAKDTKSKTTIDKKEAVVKSSTKEKTQV